MSRMPKYKRGSKQEKPESEINSDEMRSEIDTEIRLILKSLRYKKSKQTTDKNNPQKL
jgi:hypothetical protein